MTQDTFIQTLPTDPLIALVIEGLFGEYRRRYGDYFVTRTGTAGSVRAAAGPSSCCCAGAPIAMGAFKRYDAQTAELKRIWTRGDLRRRGPAQRVLQQLEMLALAQDITGSDHRLSPARKRWACI